MRCQGKIMSLRWGKVELRWLHSSLTLPQMTLKANVFKSQSLPSAHMEPECGHFLKAPPYQVPLT